jgi:hypothetical protein
MITQPQPTPQPTPMPRQTRSTSVTLPKPVEYYNQLYQNSKKASASQSARAALNELATLTPKQLAQIPDLKADSDRAIQETLYGPTPKGGNYTFAERQMDAKKRTPAAIIRERVKYEQDLQRNTASQSTPNPSAVRPNIPKIATPQVAAPKAAAPAEAPFVNMPKPVAAASTSQYSGGFLDDQGRFRSVGGAPAAAQPEPAASGMQ